LLSFYQIFKYRYHFVNQEKEPTLGLHSIEKLVEELDNLPAPERDLTSMPVLPIDHVYSIPGRGNGSKIE